MYRIRFHSNTYCGYFNESYYGLTGFQIFAYFLEGGVCHFKILIFVDLQCLFKSVIRGFFGDDDVMDMTLL